TGPPRHGVIPAGPPTTPALAPLRARRQPPTSIAPAAPPPAPPTYPSTTSTTTRVAPAAPGVPQSVSASADASGTLHVTWRAPASDGGSAITGYLVVVTPGNGGAARTLNASATAPLQARTAGLTIGVKYCAQVRAVNAVGAGPTSPSGQVCATPQQDEPGAPGNVQAVESAAGQVTVTWTAASTGPFHTPVSTYTVEGGPSPVTVTSGLSTILSGLQAGTQYQFSVIATNANRHQSPAGIAAPLITWSPPGTPTNLTLVAGNSTVTVTFSPPSSDGGSPVTGYNVTVNGTAYTQQGSGGTYSATAYQTDTVTVTAVNAVGSGQAISQGVTPFTRAPTYICMSDTNGFEFISSEASCEATATNHVSLAGPGPFQWVTAGPGPGAVPLYRTYVGDSEQWQVGSPAAGSVDGISAYVWTSAYPGATEVCEARTSDPLDPQGWYDMLYVYGTQPGACIATFWV
ncbi:MAG: fibronectin type III domain-containing protein, partial [Acidimicrobiaceae bacterium]|nr:fibronectin type III domain-containing protein [Acidimicrobiaceae bacterium]